MVIEPLSETHNRLAFSCGNDKLDRYLHEQAHQAKRKGLAATFVAIDPQDSTSKILGYYSLSSFTISGVDIPQMLRKQKGLPQHVLGATLLGRLATLTEARGRRIGELLVVDALQRAYYASREVGSVAVVVDAIESGVVGYYARYGFQQMNSDDLRLILLMDTIAALFPLRSNRPNRVEQL